MFLNACGLAVTNGLFYRRIKHKISSLSNYVVFTCREIMTQFDACRNKLVYVVLLQYNNMHCFCLITAIVCCVVICLTSLGHAFDN